jgi:hypothetical protein
MLDSQTHYNQDIRIDTLCQLLLYEPVLSSMSDVESQIIADYRDDSQVISRESSRIP